MGLQDDLGYPLLPSNLTLNESTTSWDSEPNEQNPVLNASVITMSVISLTCNIAALWIIFRCRRLAFQIKYLSCNFLFCYIGIECSMTSHSVALLVMDKMYYRLIFDSRLFCACALATVSWCSVCTVTLERLFVLTMPFDYAKHATKPVLIISITTCWCLNVLLPSAVFLINGIKMCGPYDFISLCDIYAVFRPLKLTMLGLLSVYAALIVIAYLKISSVIFHHQKNIPLQDGDSKAENRKKHFKSTVTVATVILAFVILNSPAYFHLIAFEFKPELKNQKWRIVFSSLDYLGHELNIYTNLYLYIWKFKECRMHLLLMLSKFNKGFTERCNSLRIEVYNIVTKEKSISKQSSAPL